jgi:membrane protease YdiL (CAAX protease family)
MRKIARALLGIGMWLVIYLFAVYIAPSIDFVHKIVEDHSWLSNGEVSQVTFLIISLGLILAFARGHLARYGLSGIRVGQLVKPVALGIVVSFLFFILSGVMMMASGPPEEQAVASAMSKGLFNFILTVVVLASICEEVFNRGLVQSFLSPLKKYGFRLFHRYISLPVTLCALFFGLGHLCLLGSMGVRMAVLVVISAMALGFIAGYYREKTDSLVPAIAVHMTFNIVSGLLPRFLIMAVSG